VPELREYIDEVGRSRHGEWLISLDQSDQARIMLRLDRLSLGNVSNVKSVGSGVMELKIDFGPGYRVYFGREGERLILLLGGGTKRHQQKDIVSAHAAWQAYKRRKAAGDIQWH
jgi:putative addiction module killer protein